MFAKFTGSTVRRRWHRISRRIVVPAVVLVLAAGAVFGGGQLVGRATTKSFVAYFDNTNGLFAGDRVKILGVDVGAIDTIEPRGDRMRVQFHIGSGYRLPAEVEAVVLSQSLVSDRSIQLTPAYTAGPELADGAEIPLERTAVPVEWDDLRTQLQHLADSIGPPPEGGAGPLGDVVETAAAVLDGKGTKINDTLRKMSDAMATLSNGRDDLFGTVRNLQAFVTALRASEDEIVRMNQDLGSVSAVLNNSDDELGTALQSIDALSGRLAQFVRDNRGAATKSMADLAAATTSLNEVRPDIEQLLHAAPNAIQNFYNIYQPAQGSFTGALAVTQFHNPVQFICGAIQSASGLGAAEAAKLCVSHLGPVLKLLQMNYPPVGLNAVAGLQARPEQIDHSEQWLRGTATAPSPPTTLGSHDGLGGLLGAHTGEGER